MATVRLEDKIDELDARFSKQLGELRDQLAKVEQSQGEAPASVPGAWWSRLVGVYRSDPAFDEAVRLSREYRTSLNHDSTEALN